MCVCVLTRVAQIISTTYIERLVIPRWDIHISCWTFPPRDPPENFPHPKQCLSWTFPGQFPQTFCPLEIFLLSWKFPHPSLCPSHLIFWAVCFTYHIIVQCRCTACRSKRRGFAAAMMPSSITWSRISRRHCSSRPRWNSGPRGLSRSSTMPSHRTLPVPTSPTEPDSSS